MWKNHYYCFVAGLPDIFPDEGEVGFDMVKFKEDLQTELKANDYKLIELLFLPYDNENLLKVLNDEYPKLNPLGNISQELWEQELGEDKKSVLPNYFYAFVDWYREEEGHKQDIVTQERKLLELYYPYILTTNNAFLKEWFTWNLHLKNILTGLNCRKYNLEIEEQLLLDNFVSQAVAKSNARDFGLDVDFPDVIDLVNLFEKDNILQLERGIDKIRWERLEEYTLFEYFTIEVILAYTIKLDIIFRWIQLDEETGKRLFAKFVGELKSSFEFAKEFSLHGQK